LNALHGRPPRTRSDRPTLSARFRRNARVAWLATGRGVIEFYNSNNLTYAASIAYYSLLSLFPFVVLVLNLLGRLTVAQTNDTLLHFITRALPSHLDFVTTQIEALSKTPLKLGVVGTIIVGWASMGVFGALTSAVNHAWGEEKQYSFLKHKLIAFVMLLMAAVLLMMTLVVLTTVQITQTHWFREATLYLPWLRSLTGLAVQYAPTPMFIVCVGLVYYFAPNTRVRLRDVWFGAIFAGLLWHLAFMGFAWYVRDLSRFSIHGQVAAVVVFLAWVYLSAVILLYGVEVTAAYSKLRKQIVTEERLQRHLAEHAEVS